VVRKRIFDPSAPVVYAPESATGGIVVVGMHRSGTSATTRVINLLGIPTCSAKNLWGELRGNVTGSWESSSLSSFNEQLLASAGGSWWCPPSAAAIAELTNDVDMLAAARYLFRRLHTAANWVWTHPRVSVLLPFWRADLPDIASAVPVVRHPLEVADSLHVHDRIPRPWAIALWERYVRQSVRGLNGMSVLVLPYGTLVTAPWETTKRLAHFFAELGVRQVCRPSRKLRHFSAPTGGIAITHWRTLRAVDMPPIIPITFETLQEMAGTHAPFVSPTFLMNRTTALRFSGGWVRKAPPVSCRIRSAGGPQLRVE
jgi:hypothetical protein